MVCELFEVLIMIGSGVIRTAERGVWGPSLGLKIKETLKELCHRCSGTMATDPTTTVVARRENMTL